MSDDDYTLALWEGRRFAIEQVRVEQERLAAALERQAAALERIAAAHAQAPPEPPLLRRPPGRAIAAGRKISTAVQKL